MLDVGIDDAVKLTVYVGRQERIGGLPAYRAVCDLLYRHGFSGGAVFFGVDGTAHGERYRARFFSRNVNVPLMIISIGTPAQVLAAVAELTAAAPNPLLTVERVRLCKRGGELFARPHRLPDTDDQRRPLWQKLMVHTSEATSHGGLPIHRALVHRLLDSGMARGATVLRGIWGFHGDHKPHGDKLFQLTRRVPVVTIIVDTPEWIARSFEIVDELTADTGWSPVRWSRRWCLSPGRTATVTPGWRATTTEQLPAQQRRQHRGMTAVHVAGGGHQRHDAALGEPAQLVERLAALQLLAVSRGELIETLGLVVVPLAQFFRRRNIFEPGTHPRIVFAEASRPQPVRLHGTRWPSSGPGSS